jgi:hypothetical protein
MKEKYARQIRAGIAYAQMDGYWGMVALLTEKNSKLTKRAFSRTRLRRFAKPSTFRDREHKH